MPPRVILHNSVSVDGSLDGFEVDMREHYSLAAAYGPDAHLVGSATAATGIATEGGPRPEAPEDMVRPDREASLPLWVIPDTLANLMGSLHVLRGFELCRDVVVLISSTTPEEYLRYLRERHYDHHVVGRVKVDLELSLELLEERYGVSTVLVDAGAVLGNLLIERGLVDEVSLLVHPVVVGTRSYNMFTHLDGSLPLSLRRCEAREDGLVWLVYGVGEGL
jgi:2,5-diamino-6-(ribosylamino)-4(3H)-pyrimidinone 5'-phosphate reductase